MADPAPDSTSLYKASLERLLAELAFLNANAIVSDADNAAMQNSLAAARRKLRVGGNGVVGWAPKNKFHTEE
ncbi:hypothetical protein FN846DRAFT_911997 [Sphaerosporella brunnea]|uniref:Uncharacterized protein n=1 Tax=Sphaerosporella brunnea TaxID=1250544 RepID=A0A5J5EJV2_9PEZI|nr:hypothetical protein FN846DRAFT_911997 [Sphaerosporella brunnea]